MSCGLLLKYNLTLGIQRFFNTSVCNRVTKYESHSSTRVAAEKRFETKISHVARASNEFLARQLDFGTKIVAKKPSKNDDFVKEGGIVLLLEQNKGISNNASNGTPKKTSLENKLLRN